jgi:hypothetical protein
MVIISSVEDLRDYAIKLAKLDETKAAAPEEPESIKKIKAILKKYSFSNHRELLTKLVSILVDTELKLPEAAEGFIRNTVIVPLEQMGGHDYPLNRPFFVRELGSKGRPYRGLREDGSMGNNLRGDWRFATKNEVTEFFASTNSDLQRELSKLVAAI